MLEKVIAIQNIGVLKAGTRGAVDLEKVTLVYADNARGKSTLSSILGACGSRDANQLSQRKTFGSTADQKVSLRFSGPAASFNAEFDGAAWSASTPTIAVFNQDFVERNVYASEGVRPEHREALLEFALGNAAVAEREAFERNSDIQRQKSAEISSIERGLQGYRGNLPLESFVAFEPLGDVLDQMADVDKQLVEARSVISIRSRPTFRRVPVPDFDLNELAVTLESTFESLNAASEKVVRQHFLKHEGEEIEAWVTEGISLSKGDDCPFCGQDTKGLRLIEAYRHYFDAAYQQHIAKVDTLVEQVDQLLSRAAIADWDKAMEFNAGTMSAWTHNIQGRTPPSLDMVGAYARISQVRVALVSIAREKKSKPLTHIGRSRLAQAAELLTNLVTSAEEFNTAIDALNATLDAYKETLTQVDTAELEQRRANLVARRSRFEPEVVALVDSLKQARADHRAAEQDKNAAKARLDAEMDATLKRFQADINSWLSKFGAPFSVAELKSTYKGGGVRSEYVLNVRGATVKVGPSNDGDLSFRVALSEGDKRTLAFAFFLAQLLASPQRTSTSVVLDDVFTSLDRHRRHQTAEAVVRVAHECAQVIALGHDAHFLKEVKKRSVKKKVGGVVELALLRDSEDYSYLAAFDLDEYCASDYYKHYSAVEEFVGGGGVGDELNVAKALRPLVEGHLHRCFPRRFKDGSTVGEMLDQVKNAKAPNPLQRLQPHHADLVDFNEFASAFHHDTAGSDVRMEVNVAELLPYAKGALGFIQTRAFR